MTKSSSESIILAKLDTKTEGGLKAAKENLSSYLQNKAEQRDNSPIIADAILNNKPISSSAAAEVLNVSIDITGYIETLKEAFAQSLRNHFNNFTAAQRRAIGDIETKWDPLSKTL